MTNVEFESYGPGAGSRFVIVGNSAAGLHAAISLRERCPDASITLISEEEEPAAYSRPLLPRMVAGDLPERLLWLREPNWYRESRIRLISGRRAIRVDPGRHLVHLDDSTDVAYGQLLLATGSAPHPDERARDLPPGTFLLTRRSGVKGLLQALQPEVRVSVVGQELAALHAVAALVRRGYPVRWLAGDPRLVPSLFAAPEATIVRDLLTQAGATVVTTPAASPEDGELIAFAPRLSPRLELAADAGITCAEGVLVNERMETSAPGIYAAGDVAQAWDPVYGQARVNRCWLAASRMGQVAAAAMAGEPVRYEGSIFFVATDVLGMPLVLMGQTVPGPGDQVIERRGPDPRAYRRLVIQAGRFVGAVLTGDTAAAGALSGLLPGQGVTADRALAVLEGRTA